MEVYKITNLINNKIYVGLTTRTKEKRFKEHLKNYKYIDFAIYRAFRKYGIENFKLDLIEKCENIEELIVRESFWIRTLESMNPAKGYNMINQESNIKLFSEELKNKISKSQIKRVSKLSKEEKTKIYLKSSITKQGKLRKNSKIPYRGVSEAKCGRFNCELSYLSKRYRRLFLSSIEAAKAYDKLALYLYGAEATLNFPENKKEYLKEDLLLFMDWFLNYPQKQGRPAKQLYCYEELLKESQINAKINIRKYNILNTEVPDLKYLYDGTINPDFLLKFD